MAEAGVNAAALPATRFVTFAEQGEGQFGTGVAYANPSSTSAHVTFTVRDAAGQILASVDRTLLPRGHDAHGMSDLFGLSSFTGSLEVTSTEPIVSLSINLEASPVFSSLPPGETPAVSDGPSLVSAYVWESGNALTLEFDENMDFPLGSLRDMLSITADGAPVSVAAAAAQIPGASVTLSQFAPIITRGQIVIVSYTDPSNGDDAVALQDLAGNDVASFAENVINNSTVP